MQEIRPYLELLASQAHPEGGWGFAPGRAPHPEATCLALLALWLDAQAFAEPITKAKTALERWAQDDGSYHLPGDREVANWPMSHVLFLQARGIMDRKEMPKTLARLLGLTGRKPEGNPSNEVHDFDINLSGWPWADGNFSWVEPTAWACLALRHAGYNDQPRVKEGQALLLDRAFDDGGINYGNRVVLGKRTDPIPGTTAIMLLALQGRGSEPRVQAAIEYLGKRALEGEDLEHLCWAKLALDCYRELPGVSETISSLDERIRAAHQERGETTWAQPSCVRLALTALALGAANSPFRLPAVSAKTTEEKQLPRVIPIYGRRKPLGDRFRGTFRSMALNALAKLKQPPEQSAVHIAKAADYDADLADVLQRQFASFREKVKLEGKRVVLKPNLVEWHRDKVINTHPNVVAAVIELCKREGAAEVIVAEGPGHWRNVEYLVKQSGLGDVLRHFKVPFTDLNHDEPVKKDNLGRLTGLEYLFMSRTIESADVLISLPKLKTHHWAGATLSLKNLFGTLPGICYGWPKNELHWRGIDNSIIDIALTRTPDLAIVDGIVGMEGDGPLNGTPKPMGTLIMGTDLVAVDSTCCRLMQLDPEKILYLVLGAQRKLGRIAQKEIQQLGETIESLAQPFETVPHFEVLRLGKSA